LKKDCKLFIIDPNIALYVQYTISQEKAIGLIRENGEGPMDPKLVRQFIIFLVLLFGWTIVILLAGPK